MKRPKQNSDFLKQLDTVDFSKHYLKWSELYICWEYIFSCGFIHICYDGSTQNKLHVINCVHYNEETGHPMQKCGSV